MWKLKQKTCKSSIKNWSVYLLSLLYWPIDWYCSNKRSNYDPCSVLCCHFTMHFTTPPPHFFQKFDYVYNVLHLGCSSCPAERPYFIGNFLENSMQQLGAFTSLLHHLVRNTSIWCELVSCVQRRGDAGAAWPGGAAELFNHQDQRRSEHAEGNRGQDSQDAVWVGGKYPG